MAQIIRRAEQVYLIRVFLGRDESGKRGYHNETFHGTKSDAIKRGNKLEVQRDLGTLINSSRISVGSYLESWLNDAVKGSVSQRTFQDYSEQIQRYIKPALQFVRIADLTPLHVQRLYNDMRDAGLSSRTIRYAHTVLSMALRQAVDWGFVPRNVAKMVKVPKLVRTVRINPLDAPQVLRFLSAASTDPWHTLFVLALDSGMRPEEYLGLRWPAVDLKSGVVRVQEVLVWNRKGGGWTLEVPKTERSRRAIALGPETVEMLRRHRRAQSETKMKQRDTYRPHGFVFATEDGGPLSPGNLSRRHFKRIVERMFEAELEEKGETDKKKRKREAASLAREYRLYDLRHTMATLLLRANRHPKIVSERLGHASIGITLDTYSHVLPTMQEEAAEDLAKILFPRVGTQ
jgi:integrase